MYKKNVTLSKFENSSPPYAAMTDHYSMSPPRERLRSTRSHSLKPISQPSLINQLSKRTLSLPSKPVLLPLINIERYHDNFESDSDDDHERENSTQEESLAWYTPVVGFSCSLIIYVWSCLLAYYSRR